MVWHISNSYSKSHPVAQKECNAWGFYDMQGNIFEWCSDWFHVNNTKKNIPSKEGTYRVLIGVQFTGRIKNTERKIDKIWNPKQA